LIFFSANAHGIYTQTPQLILAGTAKTTTITTKIARNMRE
jgi:hypothetical protein